MCMLLKQGKRVVSLNNKSIWLGDRLTLCEHDDDIDDDSNVENVF